MILDDMQKYNIRMATPSDAEALLDIYRYYVENTAITFEVEVPGIDEFAGRIEKTLLKYPYLVLESKEVDANDTDSVEHRVKNSAGSTSDCNNRIILGYAYASPFHVREAYQWCAETTIYLDKDARGNGLGKLLYSELEDRLKAQGILNLNACIGYPNGAEDEHLTYASAHFHEHLGYSLVGEFHQCGYKFGRWYNMIWMEKMLGEHPDEPATPVRQKL